MRSDRERAEILVGSHALGDAPRSRHEVQHGHALVPGPGESQPMNIVSVSWADHLTFGDGDGRLDTPDALRRRVVHWRDELGAGLLHWRVLRARIPGRFSAAPGYEHPSERAARSIEWDDLAIVPAIAADAGLEAWLYVSVFDEGWPLPPAASRATSYHNAMHGQHVAWQSDLTREHPEWLVVDRTGRRRQPGVVSLFYPAARRAFTDRWVDLLLRGRFEGLFICFRSQSQPAADADTFGFNEPAREVFRGRHGIDPIELFGSRGASPELLQAWRDLLGEAMTELLKEVRGETVSRGLKLGAGVARGDVVGPPLGNATLQWRRWMHDNLVDHLVIDQHSSQCPSMWHQLWPMHRGSGYVQNYLDDTGLPPLVEHVRSIYAPAARESGTALFVARQWAHHFDRPPDEGLYDSDERAMAAIAGVEGFVFSSFRYDNPEAIARGDWRAGRTGS